MFNLISSLTTKKLMKTIIKGTINDIVIIPKHLKSFSFSFAAEMKTPIIEPKNIIPEIMNIHPYTSVMIIYHIVTITYYYIEF